MLSAHLNAHGEFIAGDSLLLQSNMNGNEFNAIEFTRNFRRTQEIRSANVHTVQSDTLPSREPEREIRNANVDIVHSDPLPRVYSMKRKLGKRLLKLTCGVNPGPVGAKNEILEDNHLLQYDPATAEQSKGLLDNFGNQLCLCFEERTIGKASYQHWFVTDQNWRIELNGVDNTTACVLVQKEIASTKYNRFKTFKMNKDVYERMKDVCGATNHSWILRNSEHVARYIHCGQWISLQTTGSGNLRKRFSHLITEDNRQYLNTLPLNLRKERIQERQMVYPDEYQEHIVFEGQKQYLIEDENSAYNIVLIGPTGAGKSSMINLIFNEIVTVASAGASSATREVIFLQGSSSGEKLLEDTSVQLKHPKINVIDTIGLCDTVMTKNEVFSIIKDKLKTNLLHIDRVVIVCSGRLERDHQIEIQQFLKWFKYNDFASNFLFVYNKCDGLEEGMTIKNLSIVCDLLGINPNTTILNSSLEPPKHVPLVITTGFPPNAPFEHIKTDLRRLHDGILTPAFDTGEDEISPSDRSTIKRIPISSSDCIIL